MFPKFLIRKMYEKDSLSLTNSGFSFVVKNNIANGEVIEVFHLRFNETEIPFSHITIKSENDEFSARNISSEAPMPLKKGVSTIFSCNYEQASDFSGKEVKIEMKFKVKVKDSNMMIDFDFKDVLK